MCKSQLFNKNTKMNFLLYLSIAGFIQQKNLIKNSNHTKFYLYISKSTIYNNQKSIII